MSKNLWIIVCISALLNLYYSPGLAQTQVSDSIIQERIHLIQKLLNEGKSGANTWWKGWLIGYSAATAGQVTISFLSKDKGIRQDMVLGAATTLLGATGQIITPMTPGKAPDLLLQLPENTREELLIKLQEAEYLLKKSALREKTGRSWQAHVVCGTVNIGSGLTTWLGFKRTVWDGIGNFILNTAISEAQIWTQPGKAVKDYRNYTQKYGSGEIVTNPSYDIKWSLIVYPGRVGFKLTF